MESIPLNVGLDRRTGKKASLDDTCMSLLNDAFSYLGTLQSLHQHEGLHHMQAPEHHISICIPHSSTQNHGLKKLLLFIMNSTGCKQ